eukprot:11886883-Alexandrium_andersonii.AAC.1
MPGPSGPGPAKILRVSLNPAAPGASRWHNSTEAARQPSRPKHPAHAKAPKAMPSTGGPGPAKLLR